MPGQLQTKDIGDVKCLLRTIVIPSHVLKKTEREKNVDQLSSIPKLYPKYSKLFTVAHTIDIMCSKILKHGLNHGLSFSLFKFFG